MGMNLQIQQILSYMEKEVHKRSLLLKEKDSPILIYQFFFKGKTV